MEEGDEQDWTKEPWSDRDDDSCTHPAFMVRLFGESRVINLTDYQRALTCVNFCKGTASEWLDGSNLGQILTTSGIDRLLRVNERLLAACVKAEAHFGWLIYCGVLTSQEEPALDALRAAIAEATKQKPSESA